MRGPSGFLVYRKEGSKTVYLGRRSLEEVRRLLAEAGAEAIQRIRSDVEAVKRALEGHRPAQTQTAPSLTWKKDGHAYWLLQYGRTFYVYMKGPSTKHRPKLVEKTDVDGVIGRVMAAGAMHVVEALRLLVNGLHAAVEDLLRREPQRPAAEAQRPRSEPIPRREAEEALRELRRELSRAVKRWGERWSEGGGGLWGGPDPGWLRERLSEFLDENIHLVEKILPHRDLAGKFADAVEEETRGYILGGDVLRMLRELGR
jgi:hypothetical protein